LRRLAALAYDGLLLAGILMCSSLLVVMLRKGAVAPGETWFQGLVALQVAAYFIGFWCFGGQTPGMRAWDLKLTLSAGGRVPLRVAGARFVLACLSGAAFGFGFLTMARNADRQAWHDGMAGTRLVRAANRPGTANALSG
jgi:uncharacterized RDD family membrane protein YckC